MQLDDPEALTPEDHIYARSRLRWVVLGDRLPEHATVRADHGSDASRS